MRILAIDPASRSGFAIGRAGEIPRSGAVVLRKKREPLDVAPGNMGCWLRHTFVLERPDLIVIEAYLPPGAQKSGAAAESSILLSGAVRSMASVYGIKVEAPRDRTVRKHFIGAGHLGDRIETNLAVLRRAIALGYVPKDSRDWDRANACALFDYGAAVFAGARPQKLFLFGATK